jgi:uncharacterized protein DUF1236
MPTDPKRRVPRWNKMAHCSEREPVMSVNMSVRLCLFACALAAAPAIVRPAAAQSVPPSTAIDPSSTAPQPGQRPELTPEQKTMIFSKVHLDKTKAAKRQFPAQIGAEVPPSLELYALPDEAIMQAPVTKLFRVVVMGEKVVLVDPTTMRVVEVIER